MELFFDTETSDKLNFKNPPHLASPDFPWIVQLGAILAEKGIVYGELNIVIRAAGRTIAPGAQEVHNISVETADRTGVTESTAARMFLELLACADKYICHNVAFDSWMIRGLLTRSAKRFLSDFDAKPSYCTMLSTTGLCRLPGPYGFKWPKLIELHKHLFEGEGFVGAHDAMFDVRATMKCYYELVKIGWVKAL